MISVILSRVIIILFGTLYPAYSSFKAVRTKNVKEYVKWMMYWIVYALFTCLETFADIFISWLPFYYEAKVLFIIWLMLPATRGASIIYKKFVHPQLTRREEDIDKCIEKASDQGYTTLLALGTKSFNYAANIVLATALKGQTTIVDQLKKSYSMSDLSKDEDATDYGTQSEEDDVVEVVGDQNPNDPERKQRDDASEKWRRHKRRVKEQAEEEEGMDSELNALMENEEATTFKERKGRSKKNYDHTEVYHVGTLPRKARHTRSAINTKD